MNKTTGKFHSLPFIVLFTITLCACGKVGNLEPKTGSTPIPTAYGNDKPATADALVTANAQARPGRSVELLRRSERREDDPFELPPGKEPVPMGDASDAPGKVDPANPATPPEY